jgi:hypothetical protein
VISSDTATVTSPQETSTVTTDNQTPVTPPSVTEDGKCRRADFNCDTRVNSVDFSVLLYFWGKKPPFSNSLVDLNKDGKINSIDFSVLLYYWDKK